MTDLRAPHETDELWPFTLKIDDQAVTIGVETSIVTYGNRPTTWIPAIVLDGKTLLRIAGLPRGTHDAYARGTRGGEHAVVYLGRIALT